MKKILKDLYLACYQKVPKKYQKEWIQNHIHLNLTYSKIFAVILLIINIFLIIMDLLVYSSLFEKEVGYYHLFWIHILMLCFSSSYLILYYFKTQYLHTKKYSLYWDWLLQFVFVFVVIGWCTDLAVNAQRTHGHISAYLIGIFCFSAIWLFSPFERVCIYLFSFTHFSIGVYLVQDNIYVLLSHLLNALLMTVFSFWIARLNFRLHLRDFLNTKMILQKTIELNRLNKHLEKKIEERTEELRKSHALLMQEALIRHEAELETMKVHLLYEEESQKLKKVMEEEKLRATFFSNISHELRTPLNLIQCAEQMLEMRLTELFGQIPSKLQKPTELIKLNSYRLMRLVGNLIDSTKIDNGYVSLQRKNCNIVSVVEDITLSTVEYANRKQIELIFDTEIEEKIISCDPEKIERIMLNLLSNALKFTPAGGSIFVCMYEKNNFIHISVKDTGSGIPPYMLDKIFDRFVMVDETLCKNKTGSGIGLSLVKSLTEMHGGFVEVCSEYEKGSEFIVSLPDILLDCPLYEPNAQVNPSIYLEKIQTELSHIST